MNDRTDQEDRSSIVALAMRSVFGGTLMGLANLVPGISGGTMLLAAGVYPRFVEAVADATRFRFSFRSMLLLCCIVGSALAGIVLLAGPLKELVLNNRWVMYSLFIGLTLGGVPLVWKLGRPANASFVCGAVVAFFLMAGFAVLQAYGVVGNTRTGPLLSLFAGVAGAGAMILPGLSGGYLLLLLGQYVPILSAIDRFKEALQGGDISGAMTPAVSVLLPVGIGVILGVVVVGNLLQWLLHHQRKPTLGALLGLLVGSTVGLWPFQMGVPPEVGSLVKGEMVTEENRDSIDQEDWPTEVFTPSAMQCGYAALLIATGFAATMGVSLVGGKSETPTDGPKNDDQSVSESAPQP